MKQLISVFFIFLFQQSFAGISIPLEVSKEPPTKLSETGLFIGDVKTLTPAGELIPYEINQALWVDHAKKQRFLYLPPQKKILFSENGPWGFPVGTILVKHFRMETSFNVFKNIETRVLVRKEGEEKQVWVGYTYQWNEEDAILVTGNTSPEVELQIDATADGGARTQTFKIPSRRQCLQCHNSSVGFVRSVLTAQINREAGEANQLIQFNNLKLFDKDIGSIEKFIKFAALEDENASLEERTKSYLDVNCAHCHNPDKAALCYYTGMDFRYGEFNVEKLVQSEHLVKGIKVDSPIFYRMESEEDGMRMPYFGTSLKDQKALDVVGRWIDSL